MTQEEKAKAYDKAIRNLRGMMPYWDRLSYNGKTFLQDLIYIFPELRESKDEKIRKRIILCLEECVHSDIIRDYEKEECLAWLEKQGQKPVIEMKTPEESLGIDSETYNKIVDECIYGEQKLTWSEEDEEMYQNIHECLKNGWRKLPTDLLKYESWIKSLKQRIGE